MLFPILRKLTRSRLSLTTATLLTLAVVQLVPQAASAQEPALPDGCELAGAMAGGAVLAAASSGPQSAAGGALAAGAAITAAAATERVCSITAEEVQAEVARMFELMNIRVVWYIFNPGCHLNAFECRTPVPDWSGQYSPGTYAFVTDVWSAVGDGFSGFGISGPGTDAVRFSPNSLANAFGNSFNQNVDGNLGHYASATIGID